MIQRQVKLRLAGSGSSLKHRKQIFESGKLNRPHAQHQNARLLGIIQTGDDRLKIKLIVKIERKDRKPNVVRHLVLQIVLIEFVATRPTAMVMLRDRTNLRG